MELRARTARVVERDGEIELVAALEDGSALRVYLPLETAGGIALDAVQIALSRKVMEKR